MGFIHDVSEERPGIGITGILGRLTLMRGLMTNSFCARQGRHRNRSMCLERQDCHGSFERVTAVRSWLKPVAATMIGAFLLSGCAAGHIQTISAPVDDVYTGLSEAQIELRVSAKALGDAPWSDTEAPALSAFSLSSIMTVMIDGVQSLTPPADQDSTKPDATERPEKALSAQAQAYLAGLDGNRTDPRHGFESDLMARASVTRRFLAAASRVAAEHRIAEAGPSRQSNARQPDARRPNVSEDRALIVEVSSLLKAQRAVFGEVAGVLEPDAGSDPEHRAGNAPASASLGRILALWNRDVEAIAALSDALPGDRLI